MRALHASTGLSGQCIVGSRGADQHAVGFLFRFDVPHRHRTTSEVSSLMSQTSIASEAVRYGVRRSLLMQRERERRFCWHLKVLPR